MRAILFIFLVTTLYCEGQQNPQYSQYIQNQYMVNPGACGVNDYMALSLGGRMQWTGFENAPKTSYLYFAAPLSKLRGASMKRTYGKVHRSNKRVIHPTMRMSKFYHAFGAHVLADQYGPFRTMKLMGTYAIHLPLTRDYTLSFGTNVGLSSRTFLPDKAQVLSVMTNTGYYDQTYNTYTSNQQSQYTMDVEAGFYFHGKGIFAGISASQLTKDFVKFGNRTVDFDPKMHFMVSGGYKFQITNALSLTPAVLVKYMRPAPLSVEGSVQFDYRERFIFGMSYRHKDALVALLGYTISEKFKIGYSFDFSISKLVRYNSGGHEIVLSLMLNKSKNFSAKY